MRSRNFGINRRLVSVLSLCLCLALISIAVLGAVDRTYAATAGGSPPDITVFVGEPSTLQDDGFVIYKFEVLNATNVRVVEAGEIIKQINNPNSANLKGEVKGRMANQIRSNNINEFDTILLASNTGGRQEKKVTIKFARVVPPKTSALIPPVSDNQSTQHRTKWGPPTSTPSSQSATPTVTNWPPQFAKCPSDCNNCLKPDEAAGRGLTKKCLEQPCYYSPDKQQDWYCYGKAATVWCCKDGKVIETTGEQCAQIEGSSYATEAEANKACQQALGYCCRDGQIAQITKTQCAEVGGSYWSTDKNEVIKACQREIGWFCYGGKVYQGTATQAAQVGATLYATQAEATTACQPIGYCCRNGQLTQSTKAQCSSGFAAAGTWYATSAEAQLGCTATYWCCSNGQIYQSKTYGRGCYSTQAEAQQACMTTYWCCSNGQVYQTSSYTTGCYKTQTEAMQACERQAMCWCCMGGKVSYITQAQCTQYGGTCYSTQSQATSACTYKRYQ
ncbi:MAG: hypothetical protein PHO26_00625 [Dehalococcoidia bacterium]|nr:hypothetical protein [Dehalococcoidia bacterium]MDD5494362.1 hypothetical protein [Dehalococcoidia bacterium]